MFTLRNVGRISLHRPVYRKGAVRPNLEAAIAGRRYAHEGYGDNSDQSIADTPEARGEKSGQEQKSATQGSKEQSSNKGQTSSGDKSGKSSSKGTAGARPKILDESPPHTGEEPPEVAQHNRELSQRADKAHESVSDEDVEKDKVGKGFWSGG